MEEKDEHQQAAPLIPKPTLPPHDPHTNHTTITRTTISTTISLRNLTTHATLGSDAWSRPSKPQPLHLSLYLSLPLPPARFSSSTTTRSTTDTDTDTLAHTFSYSNLAHDITAHIQGQSYKGLEHLTQAIATVAEAWPGHELRVEVRAPKAVVRGEGGVERVVWLGRGGVGAGEDGDGGGGGIGDAAPTTATNEAITGDSKWVVGQSWRVLRHEYALRSLRLACIIGVNPHERLQKQDVVFHIRFFMRNPLPSSATASPQSSSMDKEPKHPQHDNNRHNAEESEIPWQDMVPALSERIEASSFQTLEVLAGWVAWWLLQETWECVEGVSVGVEKPFALAFVGGAGVEVVRMNSREA